MAIVPMMLAAAIAPSEAPLWEMVPPVPDYLTPCPLPAESWATVPRPLAPNQLSNNIGVEPGMLTWNGLQVDEQALRDYVHAVSLLRPRPRTILYAASPDCPGLRRIAALIAEEAGCTPADCVVFFEAPPRRSIPAPPAPPGPPSPPPSGKRPTPRGSPQNWVLNNDYPPEAVRRRMQGTTGFRLQIDQTGAVTGCTVTASSGHPLLDETACALLGARAEFNPAEDANGAKVASSWSSRFRWELPSDRSPLASWARVVRYRSEPSGSISDCTTQAFGPAPYLFDLCRSSAPAYRSASGRNTKSVWIEIRYVHQVDGSPLSLPPAAGPTIFRQSFRYAIDAGGDAVDCKADQSGEDVLSLSMYGCYPGFDYSSAEAGRDPGHRASFTVSATATPATP